MKLYLSSLFSNFVDIIIRTNKSCCLGLIKKPQRFYRRGFSEINQDDLSRKMFYLTFFASCPQCTSLSFGQKISFLSKFSSDA